MDVKALYEKLEGLGPREKIKFALESAQIAGEIVDGPDAPFMAFQPSEILKATQSLELYRAHVKELYARWKAKEDLRPGTMAEICAALHHSSLRFPFNNDGAAAYEVAFQACVERADPERFFRESYPGCTKEIHDKLSRALTCSWRKASR